MVGVITKEDIYLLLIEISNNKKTNVYWYRDNDIETGIEKLKEKNCKIILTDQDYSKVNDSNINFISLNINNNDNAYILNDKDLINAVTNADEEKVIEILDKMDIPKDKDIMIIDQSLIFIKKIIEEKFSNQVITKNDIILKEIEESNEEGQIYLIN